MGPFKSVRVALSRESAMSLAAVGMDAPFAASSDIGALLQSSMIWLDSAPTGTQAYVAFRKEFVLEEIPESAVLHLFADTRYILWVNGRYVERGPCRFDPKAPEYDSVDVRGFLVEGANVIALLVQHCHDGKDLDDPAEYHGRSMRHVPGLTARLDCAYSGGSVWTLATDTTWRATNRTRFRPGKVVWSGSVDDVDARLDAGDWASPGFDDSQWETATPVDGSQWGALGPRAIPMLEETEVAGMLVVDRSGENVSQSLSEALPLKLDTGGRVVIDVGRFVQGYSVMDMDADEGSVLELEYAQAFHGTGREPTMSRGHEGRYIAGAGSQVYMSTDTYGFKYLVVRVLSGRVELRGVKVVNRLYPFKVEGAFDCDDAMLGRLWQMGVDTVLTCSEDAYVDCAARERVEWLGDGVVVEYPITRVALAGPGDDGRPLYADHRLLRNMLRHIGQSLDSEGRVKAHHPSDRWDIHGYIEDYSCLWVHGIRQYCDYTTLGDAKEFARETWPALSAQVQWFLKHKTERGLLDARDFVFPGNPLVYHVCEAIALNSYLYQALTDAAHIAALIGETEQQQRYTQEAKALLDAIDTHLWQQEAGTYHGAIEGGVATPSTVHGTMMALYFQVVPAERLETVRRWLLANYQEESVSPYAHMFLFEVLYRMDTDEADKLVLDLMRNRWKEMVLSETGTLWEGFRPDEYCHNMGATPSYMLSRYVLGVRLDKPVVERQIIVEPRLGDLGQVRGTVVTELGPVPVAWSRNDESGALSFEVTVPQDVAATVNLPRVSTDDVVLVDGREVEAQSLSQRKRFINIELGAGRHTGTVAPRQ